jgi:hypothetical protein
MLKDNETVRDESSEVMQFHVTMATNSQALTRCTNVNHVAGHEQASILLFECIVSFL